MERKQKLAKILLIFLIILFFCLLCLLLGLQFLFKNEKPNQESTNVTTSESHKPKTIQEVIEKYNSEYISQENDKIYVKFSKKLYEEDGKSNEQYFTNLVNELTQFFMSNSFYLIDEENKIEIYAKFDFETEKHIIFINNIEKFYEKTDGESYIKVETSEIVKPSALNVSNGYLERLVTNQMFLSSIEEYLGEGKELESGYISYNENKIRLKLLPNKSVMNIIFSDSYEYDILSDVEADTPLSEVYKRHNDNTFGSLNDGYLGYRSNNLYYFFYEDEVSVYGYSYAPNNKFEDLLEEYLRDAEVNDIEETLENTEKESKLDTFVKSLSKQMLSYDTFEYSKEDQTATMIFPTRGIEIKIDEKNPNGITLYSNYYFSDKTKEMVKNGLISYSTDDLVEKYEIQRRGNT